MRMVNRMIESVRGRSARAIQRECGLNAFSGPLPSSPAEDGLSRMVLITNRIRP